MSIHIQLQIRAAKGLCKYAELFHHLPSDSMVSESLFHTYFVHQHDIPSDHSGPVVFTDFYSRIADYGITDPGNIKFSGFDRCRKPFFGINSSVIS